MASLQLKLLGGFSAGLSSGQTVEISGRKNWALLAYLALNAGKKLSREKLVGLLWSDRGDSHGRNSLRQNLVLLRRDLAGVDPPPVVFDGDTLTLDTNSVEVDVAKFERLATSTAAADLQQAAAIYAGDLLDGISVSDLAFDEWVSTERSRLRDVAISALGRLVEHQSAAEAIATAKRLVALDPLREASHCALMHVYAAQGQFEQAIRQHHYCRDILRSELDVGPSAKIENLYREIKEGKYRGRSATMLAASEPASSPPEKPSIAVLPSLPDKPAIAVLPFVNMSGDSEQEFFADGLTEDITAALSRISALWVIARTSTFTYKGKPTDVKRVARELDVRYVMEGGVRRAGDRLRVTAQLIDAVTGRHVWAERYDRTLSDLFDIQDEITRSVAASTQTQLDLAEGAAAESRPSTDFKARDLAVRGWAKIYDETLEAIAEASDLAEEAIRIDPANPLAHRVCAYAFMYRIWFGQIAPSGANVTRALELARAALRVSQREEMAHWLMALAYGLAGRIEEAVAECERGLEINPNCSVVLSSLGDFLATLGRSQEGIEAIRLALRLNPRDPSNFWLHFMLSKAHLVAATYDAALEESKKVALSRLHLNSAIIWAASAAALDRAEEVRAAVEYCLAQRPDLRVGNVVPGLMFRFARDEDHQRLLALLRKAGLPE